MCSREPRSRQWSTYSATKKRPRGNSKASVYDMRAPQYPEGLNLAIYTNTIKGDVDKINTLNHYVGMHAIRNEDFREFRFLPQALTGFGVLALLGGELAIRIGLLLAGLARDVHERLLVGARGEVNGLVGVRVLALAIAGLLRRAHRRRTHCGRS